MTEPTDTDHPAGVSFEDRERWDLDAWPEMYRKLQDLQAMVFFSEPGLTLNLMVFTMASMAAGCRHCQAHGAYGLDGLGVDLDKITALWSFETSDLFDQRERAALRFGLAAGSVPNSVSGEHHADLRSHFSDAEVRTLLGVVGVSGFMNRFNDSLATVTDEASSEWAAKHLSPLGWDIGKHTGAEHERRAAPPGGAH
jgi:alkylhydroperoxidase family enzyme